MYNDHTFRIPDPGHDPGFERWNAYKRYGKAKFWSGVSLALSLGFLALSFFARSNPLPLLVAATCAFLVSGYFWTHSLYTKTVWRLDK